MYLGDVENNLILKTTKRVTETVTHFHLELADLLQMMNFFIHTGHFRELGKYDFAEKCIGKQKKCISIKDKNAKKMSCSVE